MRILLIMAVALGLIPGVVGLKGQVPQPSPKLSLVPLAIINVGFEGVSQGISSPIGASRPTPEFILPKILARGGTRELTVVTTGGNIEVRFSNAVPPGVSSGAFQWEQTTLPAGNAIGHLKYSGCAGCPDSFTLHLTASSNNTVETAVNIRLTSSSGRPVITGISRQGGDDLHPAFKVQFEPTTFESTDSRIVVTYASGLKYRLPLEPTSQISQGDLRIIVPRVEASRDVKLTLINPFGASTSTIRLPQQLYEDPPFVSVNSSNEFPGAASLTGNPNFSIKHSAGVLESNGTDDIRLQPLANTSSCDQVDFIYTGAKAAWLDANEKATTSLGTTTIVSQPPTNSPLRNASSTTRVSWKLNALNSDKFLQVAFSSVKIVGICSDRIVH